MGVYSDNALYEINDLVMQDQTTLSFDDEGNCKCFLANYAKEGNSQKFLLQMIPQYIVFVAEKILENL